jgi:hypothetical protein
MRPTETIRLTDQLLLDLKSRASEMNDLDSEWRLRLAQLAFHRDAEAVEVSSNLPAGVRKMLTALIRAGVAVRQVARNPFLVGEEPLQRVEELRQVLADGADPVIPAVALCSKVVTFGVYEEMTDESLVAGQTAQTIVYTEIKNFNSELTDDGQYRTQLGTRLELFTVDGRSVWQHEEPEIVDVCRSRRSDFFIAQRVTLPPTLPAGDYILKILVEDKLSGKATEVSHPFVMNSAWSIANRR